MAGFINIHQTILLATSDVDQISFESNPAKMAFLSGQWLILLPEYELAWHALVYI